jgi:hypothetical protein
MKIAEYFENVLRGVVNLRVATYRRTQRVHLCFVTFKEVTAA